MTILVSYNFNNTLNWWKLKYCFLLFYGSKYITVILHVGQEYAIYTDTTKGTHSDFEGKHIY